MGWVNTLRTVLLLACLSVTALAQSPGTGFARHFSVSQQGSQVRLQVTATTPLREVLDAFCSEQKMQCAGTDSLAGFPVPGMTVSGTTESVLSTLLQGTGINYSLSRTASGAPSQLTVLGHAPAGTQQDSGPGSLRDGDSEAAKQLQASEVRARAELTSTTEPESAEESARSDRVMEAIFGGLSNAAGENTASGASGSVSGVPAQPANAKVPEFLPFPDQFGNPIRTTPSGPPAFLPFPDHNGNPIPVTPVPVQGPPIPLQSQ